MTLTPRLSRRGLLNAAAAAFVWPGVRRRGPRWLRARARPTLSQLIWQRDERALFLHFGVNTFTDREWGDGTEDPSIFAPAGLDARQWARSARAAGFRALILTAKHHDGFCLWPTRTTRHSVAASPWRSGTGDLVHEFVDACRAEDLRAGLYCSPWDRNSPVYGDSPRYNDLFCDQLTELLTGYGAIHEVWFDGANGEGPNGRKQVYDWPRFFGLVKRLQPDSVIFSDAGPDLRWIGNERGSAGDPNWSPVDPDAVPYPGAEGDHVIQALQHGDPNGTVWRPGESDVSIRPGWFYHPAEDDKVKTGDQLVELFFSSVGRNSKLLLNVPPTRTGLLHDRDVAALQAAHSRLGALLSGNRAAGRGPRWHVTGNSATAELDLGRIVRAGVVDLREDIEEGQRVARYQVEGSDGGNWIALCSGTTIGYRRLDRIRPTPVRRLRVHLEETVEAPRPVSIHLYEDDSSRTQDNGLSPES